MKLNHDQKRTIAILNESTNALATITNEGVVIDEAVVDVVIVEKAKTVTSKVEHLKTLINKISARNQPTEFMSFNTLAYPTLKQLVGDDNIIQKEKLEVSRKMMNCVMSGLMNSFETPKGGIDNAQHDLEVGRKQFDKLVVQLELVSAINMFWMMFLSITGVLLIEFANVFAGFANAIQNLRFFGKVKILFWCLRLCINIGTPIAVIIYRWLYYYIVKLQDMLENMIYAFINIDVQKKRKEESDDGLSVYADIIYMSITNTSRSNYSITKGMRFHLQNSTGSGYLELKDTLYPETMTPEELLEPSSVRSVALTCILVSDGGFEKFDESIAITKITNQTGGDYHTCFVSANPEMSDNSKFNLTQVRTLYEIIGTVRMNVYRSIVGGLRDNWFIDCFGNQRGVKPNPPQMPFFTLMQQVDINPLLYLFKLEFGGCGGNICDYLSFPQVTFKPQLKLPNIFTGVLIPNVNSKFDEIQKYCTDCITQNYDSLEPCVKPKPSEESMLLDLIESAKARDMYADLVNNDETPITKHDIIDFNLTGIEDEIANMESDVRSFNMLGDQASSMSFNNDILLQLTKIEVVLQDIDNLISNLENGDYVDILNSFSNQNTSEMSADAKEEFYKKMDSKENALNNWYEQLEADIEYYELEILDLNFQLAEAENIADVSKRSKKVKGIKAKIVKYEQKKEQALEDKKLILLEKGRIDESRNAVNGVYSVAFDPVEPTTQMKAVGAAVLDNVCCVMSIILVLATSKSGTIKEDKFSYRIIANNSAVKKGEYIMYNGILYYCHISVDSFSTDMADFPFTIFVVGSLGVKYKKDDWIFYNDLPYLCLNDYVFDTPIDERYFTMKWVVSPNSEDDGQYIHENVAFRIFSGTYDFSVEMDPEGKLLFEAIKLWTTIVANSGDVAVNILSLKDLTDKNGMDSSSTKSSMESKFGSAMELLVNPLSAVLVNSTTQIIHNTVYSTTQLLLSHITFDSIGSILNTPNTDNQAVPRILNLIREGQCASLSYAFSASLVKIIYYQRMVATMAALLQKDYNFDINFASDMSIEWNFEWTTFFGDMSDFIFENLDLLFQICNLQTEAERIVLTSKLTQRYMEKQADAIKKNDNANRTPPVMPPDSTTKTKMIESTSDGVRSYKVDIVEYSSALKHRSIGVGGNIGNTTMRFLHPEGVVSSIDITNVNSIEYIVKES